MTIRIDDEPAETSQWDISTNYEAVGRWRGASAIPLIKRMLRKGRLIARITPYGENPETVVFDIRGLEEAVKPLRDACSW
jgi:type VI secretion system protein VasI